MDSEGLHTSHLEYDFDSRSIMIVELSGIRHDEVVLQLGLIMGFFNFNVTGNMNQPIRSFGAGRHGAGNEPDMTLKHRLDTSMGADEGPFVLEVGDSQSMGSLQRKANMWLARDYVRLVVIISIIEYIDGNVGLLFLAYDKHSSVRNGNHFLPTLAKSFGVSLHSNTIAAITRHTGLNSDQILYSRIDNCNAPNKPEYFYEVPQHIFYQGVPGWNVRNDDVPPFVIDLFLFRSAALGP